MSGSGKAVKARAGGAFAGLVLQSFGVRSPHSSPLSLTDLLVTTGWDVKGECSVVC